MKIYFNKNVLLILTLVISISFSVNGQVKSLYVNDFKFVVGNTIEENKLLKFAQDSGYTYLILYNLYYIHNNLFEITDSLTALPLSNFISKAKTDYGILYIGGVGETYNSFNNIHDYNLDHIHSPLQRIDVYNIEFEFWNEGSTGPDGYYCTTYLETNGLTCDTTSAFEFILEDLCRLDSLCDEYDWLISEVYIGSPTERQCADLAQCIDRVLIHYYRSSDVYVNGNSIYNYKSERLPALTDSVASIRVMPIFNGRSSFMGPWLLFHPEDQAYETWWYGLNGYDDDIGSWKTEVTIDGYVWYRYTSMYEVVLPLNDHFFDATKEFGGIQLNWSNADIESLIKVIIQKSNDGKNWESIYQIDSKELEGQMYYFDDNISNTQNYYRLVFNRLSEIDYSEIMLVEYFEISNQLIIWPNPTSKWLSINDGSNNTINGVEIYNLVGELIKIDESGNSQISLIDFDKGIYILNARIGNYNYSSKFLIKK